MKNVHMRSHTPTCPCQVYITQMFMTISNCLVLQLKRFNSLATIPDPQCGSAKCVLKS